MIRRGLWTVIFNCYHGNTHHFTSYLLVNTMGRPLHLTDYLISVLLPGTAQATGQIRRKYFYNFYWKYFVSFTPDENLIDIDQQKRVYFLAPTRDWSPQSELGKWLGLKVLRLRYLRAFTRHTAEERRGESFCSEPGPLLSLSVRHGD